MSDEKKVKGEGDYAAAKRYREDAEKFVEQNDVGSAAEEAKRARQGDERKELDKAEDIGKAKAKAFDPQVKRD